MELLLDVEFRFGNGNFISLDFESCFKYNEFEAICEVILD